MRLAGGNDKAKVTGQAESEACPKKSRRRTLWIAGVVILAASIGVGWWVTPGRTQVSAQKIGERVPDEGFELVPIGMATAYKAYPPASGTHYPVPAQAGVYPDGQAPGFSIHRLEHGYIVLLYKFPMDPTCSLVRGS